MHRFRTLLVALFAVFALVVAACGDDDAGDANTSSGATDNGGDSDGGNGGSDDDDDVASSGGGSTSLDNWVAQICGGVADLEIDPEEIVSKLFTTDTDDVEAQKAVIIEFLGYFGEISSIITSAPRVDGPVGEPLADYTALFGELESEVESLIDEVESASTPEELEQVGEVLFSGEGTIFSELEAESVAIEAALKPFQADIEGAVAANADCQADGVDVFDDFFVDEDEDV